MSNYSVEVPRFERHPFYILRSPLLCEHQSSGRLAIDCGTTIIIFAKKGVLIGWGCARHTGEGNFTIRDVPAVLLVHDECGGVALVAP